MYENVLVAVDGSPAADHALERAIDLAETYGAALHVITVVEVDRLPAEMSSGEVLADLEATGKAALDDAVARAREADLSAIEAFVTEGTPHQAIGQYAAEYDVDLVVMGTHGRTGLDRHLIGSVAERTLRTSPVPVMVVPDE